MKTETLISRWRDVFTTYTRNSGVNTQEQLNACWVSRTQELMQLWNNEESYRKVFNGSFALCIHLLTEEYQKLVEYQDRFGYSIPEAQNTGGRWLP